ncbi:Undecaprenyl-phosphate mannosyltransferase [Mariniblastus fucicola]|uniref:Undecaprenyl-phosphate mannosyltransferase n=2 Tax=Mariniblastus fucicola TaxID=980251 RepID=A0A5B9PFM2_9BACT|nr:Undecaprenyl-phosphate mannosyltransferase [Mariniblastus fucicola]
MPRQGRPPTFHTAQNSAMSNPVAKLSNSTTQPDTDARFEEMLTRLRKCEGLVEQELDEYRSTETPVSEQDANETQRDYLLSIVIPVYNEEATVARVVSRVAALPLNSELVIVDDCSTDGTRAILGLVADLPQVQVILKDKNAGKGAALRTGFENATGDFIIVQDADLEYDPRDIPPIIQPLLRGEADIVYGSRFIGDVVHDESFIHRLGNAVLTQASNLFSGLNLTDMETCYKAFTREAMEAVDIEQERFGIEPEITAKLARRGFRFKEVPISFYESRGYDEGKKIGIKDLFNAFWCIGRYGISD